MIDFFSANPGGYQGNNGYPGYPIYGYPAYGGGGYGMGVGYGSG